MQPKTQTKNVATKRWYPRPGDLVFIPSQEDHEQGVYGIVVSESKNNNKFEGTWWVVLHDGSFKDIHIHALNPLFDAEGKWLRT